MFSIYYAIYYYYLKQVVFKGFPFILSVSMIGMGF